MRLKKLIGHIRGVRRIEGKPARIDVRAVTSNSKSVRDGYLFIAVKGVNYDGTDFVDEAVERGAGAIVLEASRAEGAYFKKGPVYIYVEDARIAMGDIAKAFYGDISKELRLTGITGTNGKTTTTYLLEAILRDALRPVGVIGTINYRFGKRVIPSINTTPCIIETYSLLNDMRRDGIKDAILEVSSHSLEQGRLGSLLFDIAVFTNLTPEHLDYHISMRNYLEAKAGLFRKIKREGAAVVNIDDSASSFIIETACSSGTKNIITFGINKDADLRATRIISGRSCISFTLRNRMPPDGTKEIKINSPLVGTHNVYNILAASACAASMGIGLKDIASSIKKVSFLPGRLERIECGQDFLVVVDYAHTEHGLENVLSALRDLKYDRLLCVFGCGGNRDRRKRPLMGRVASELSDMVFVTTDNPRNEDALEIIKDVLRGITRSNYVVEPDRAKAIEKALGEAKKGDVVLIAGKGHETYQIFNNTTLPFDDREVARNILKRMLDKQGGRYV